MSSYTSLHTISLFLGQNQIKFFTLATIAHLAPQLTYQGQVEIIARLQKKHLVRIIKRGLYENLQISTSPFDRANVLVQPSYISLESALHHYGILPQFPHTITSVTPKKTKAYHLDQTYEFTHLQPSLFTGFTKTTGFCIATPEKALADYLYLAAKGLRQVHLDEYDLSSINHQELTKYSWTKDYAL